MIISHKHKFIFIKTRKTAGSTLEKMLVPYLDLKLDVCTGSARDGTPQLNDSSNGQGHASWQYIASKFPISWNEYYKFTIERNPWDKVVSAYFWHKCTKPYLTEKGFEHYIKTCNLLPTDWYHYSNESGPLVDDIFLFEDMGRMYSVLNERFGLDIQQDEWKDTKLKSGLREINHYSEIHTSETIERTAQLFRREILAFGYEYE